MTVSTLPFILMLLLALRAPERLRLFLLGGMLTFTDAAVLGSPSVSCAWVTYLAFLGLGIRPRFQSLRAPLMSMSVIALLLLVPYDVICMFLVENVFKGKFLVLPSASGFLVNQAFPVDVFSNHWNQLIYLFLSVASVVIIGAAGEERGDDAMLDLLDRIMLGFATFGVVIGLWQWAWHTFGAPRFPIEFFHSSLHSGNEAKAWNQGLGGLKRISGPFDEPSVMGNQLGTAICCLLGRAFSAPPRGLRAILIGLGIATLALTTSSTAFLMIAVIVALMIANVVFRTYAKSVLRVNVGSLVADWGVLCLLAVLLVLGASILLSDYKFQQVMYDAIIYKGRTESYVQRGFANQFGIEAFIKTGGIGVGIGGHVASSVVLTILSNVGIFGSLVFLAVVVKIMAGPAASLLNNRNLPLSVWEARLSLGGMLTGLLAAGGASGGNISFPIVWIGIGFGLYFTRSARLARVRHSARLRAWGGVPLRFPRDPKQEPTS